MEKLKLNVIFNFLFLAGVAILVSIRGFLVQE